MAAADGIAQLPPAVPLLHLAGGPPSLEVNKFTGDLAQMESGARGVTPSATVQRAYEIKAFLRWRERGRLCST